MSSHRKISLVTGVFFIITIIPAPIAAFILYAPVLNDPDYIVGAGADTIVELGAFLEVIVAIAMSMLLSSVTVLSGSGGFRGCQESLPVPYS